LLLKNSGVAERVDADDLAGVRVVDERLRLATPAERVPHRGSCSDHRAGGVDGVAAFDERGGAGSRGERLAGDGDPVLAVERRLDGFGIGDGASERKSRGQDCGTDEGVHGATLRVSGGHLS
jgi:hypothetical protein